MLRAAAFIEPCLPSPADKPPSGSKWIHEIKHDGYRLMARRDPVGIRLITRRGNDWTERYPLISMCHRPQWRRPYRSTLNPLKARSYSTPGLATTSRSASLGRQARGCCRLHHGRFALSWSRGQSHSALKSLGVLMASMDRKSNLRRDDPSSCLLSDGWSMSALAGFADSGWTSRQVR